MNDSQPRDPVGRFGTKTGSRPDPDILHTGNTALADRHDDEIWQEIIDATQASARAASRRKQVDADEVEGRVLAALISRETSEPGWLKASIEEHGSMAGYVSTCCRNAAYRLANNTHTDRETRARAELNRRELGHNSPVSAEQRAAWIEEIEADNPTLGPAWYGSKRATSLDDLNPAQQPACYDSSDDTGDAADVYERLRGDGTSEWGALVDAVGAPPVSGQHLAEEQAAKVRRTVDELGGAAALLSRWSNDDWPSDEQEAADLDYALFNPWGSVRERRYASEGLVSRWAAPSFDAKADIIGFLTRYGDAGSAKMWDAAVSDATWVGKRRSRERGGD
jgi:hypothetical protein